MKIMIDAAADESNPCESECVDTGAPPVPDQSVQDDSDVTYDGAFYMCLFNNFMIHHNNTNEMTKHMFDGIDYKDDTSTTFTMESFYKTMTAYNDNKLDNPEKIKLINPDNDNELINAEDLYCLKVSNNVCYYCQDIFALLLDVTEKKYGNWKIETLR